MTFLFYIKRRESNGINLIKKNGGSSKPLLPFSMLRPTNMLKVGFTWTGNLE